MLQAAMALLRQWWRPLARLGRHSAAISRTIDKPLATGCRLLHRSLPAVRFSVTMEELDFGCIHLLGNPFEVVYLLKPWYFNVYSLSASRDRP